MKLILRTLFAAVAVILFSLGAAPATAQAPDTFPVLLSASGGVSRGAYQAGVNWALVQVFRGSRDSTFRERHNLKGVYRVAVATGASAGNVNATFSAIEDCAAPTATTPENSLFWQLWANTGWDQLNDMNLHNPRTDSSLLSRRYLEDHVFPEVVRRMGEPGALSGCDVPIGITLTKVERDSVVIRPELRGRGLTAATQRLATVFAIRERDGRLIFAYPPHRIWKNGALGKVILGPPLEGTEAVTPTWIRNAMQASGAFPLAFQPVSLTYHDADRLDTLRQCTRAGTDCDEEAVFIDGGLFDNNPLTLALEMYGSLGNRRPPRWQANTRVIYIDTDKLRGAAARAAARPQVSAPEADRGLGTLLQVAGASLPAAREYELQALARMLANDPVKQRRAEWIDVTTRSRPMLGGYLGGFAAFLGKPFREYDFYTGIYDGLQYAATAMTDCALPEGEARCQAETLRGMITDPAIPLGQLAPHALRASYQAEYGEFIPLWHVPEPQTDRDRTRLALLHAMIRATDALMEHTRTRPWNNALNCANRPWEEALVCTDGFEYMLQVFSAHARHEIDRWALDPACAPERWDTSPELCPAEASFAALVVTPRRAVRQIADRLVYQLWRVEDLLENDPGTRPFSHENEAEIVGMLYHVFGRRKPTRPGMDWDPSSIQDVGQHRRRAIASALPYAFNFILDGGKEVEWRPTYNTGKSWFATTFPLTLAYRIWSGRVEPAVGVGALWRTPWPLLSGIEWRAHAVLSLKQDAPSATAWATGPTVYLLADRVRVSARAALDPDPLIQGGEPWAVSIGINDVNGLIYWLGRLSWAERKPGKVPPPPPAMVRGENGTR